MKPILKAIPDNPHLSSLIFGVALLLFLRASTFFSMEFVKSSALLESAYGIYSLIATILFIPGFFIITIIFTPIQMFFPSYGISDHAAGWIMSVGSALFWSGVFFSSLQAALRRKAKALTKS